MEMLKNLPIRIWDALRSSLWFVPALIVSAMVVLAVVLVYANGTVDEEVLGRFPRLFGAGAEGSRGLLTAVASSMISVAGVTFSITIVVLSLASNQYSPRILRNFLRDRFNQSVLGIFLGIYAYCLIVVRTIRADGDPFVPSLAVLGGVVLALFGVGVLIAFIHHIIASIQAGQIISEAASETLGAIDHLFPEPIGDPFPEGEDPGLSRFLGQTAWLPIPARRSGYVCRVDGEALLGLAERVGAVARVEYAPGDFCVEGMPLVSLAFVPEARAPLSEAENRRELFRRLEDGPRGDEAKVDLVAGKVDALYILGKNRTVGQDVGFGIQQVVDVALKALSPGINETTTAISCIHYLAVILSRLASRKVGTRGRASDGKLRVIAERPSFEGLLDQAFDEIRRNAEGNVSVLDELLVALGTIGTFSRDADRRRALRRHVVEIAAVADRSVAAPSDRGGLEARIRRALVALGDPDGGDWSMGGEPPRHAQDQGAGALAGRG
ncbi:DUF2254 domain-containing protein [Tautonia plasticadhaerens]|uniref:DUF2254 domain-containing protein n=1 Tax=Tautonia plasticadhaerens TaxID=2527974 RepID=A0A518GZ43_9BACT|nr:DUF2254 domain-containing protein [Tautonia plasticadhaerens]QDV33865.1 hypothetical protein ElP_17450 [Tautonia plasticadhaerens]